MELTWSEIKEIANRLDDTIWNNFHLAAYDTVSERDIDHDFEINDEDIRAIIEQLKTIL